VDGVRNLLGGVRRQQGACQTAEMAPLSRSWRGSIKAILAWLHNADHRLAPLRRSRNGSIGAVGDSGYVFINHTFLTCYWASRHSKEHLIFLSAVAGAFLLVVARVLAYLVCRSSLGEHFARTVHIAAPYPGIGTATGAFFLGFIFRFWFNKTWTRTRSPLWHYAKGTFSELEGLLFKCSNPTEPDRFLRRHPWGSLFLGLICWQKVTKGSAKLLTLLRGGSPAADDGSPLALNGDGSPDAPLPLMLCMKNRKIYVGYVRFALPMRAESKPFITIVPAWSGYRDKDTLVANPTEDYDRVIEVLAASNAATVTLFEKVICIDDIETANLYDPETFALFNGVEVDDPSSDEDTTG